MPTTSNYFCLPCRTFMRPEENGIVLEEKMDGNQPYKLWQADEWKCPKCGHGIIAGFAQLPIAEHFQPDYNTQRHNLIASSTFYEERL